jgi:tetratricopeptide (TPR) repeat protein
MTRWAWTILLVLALAAPAAAAESPARQTERAHAAYRAGRYQEALEAARKAAQASPRALDAVLLHADLAEFLGEFDEAGRAYSQAQALAPNDMLVHYRIAVYAVRIGDYDRAVRELDAVLALQPDEAQLIYRYAPTAVQKVLLRHYRLLEQLTQVKIDVLMEKDDLAAARALARGYGIVEADRDYCGEARALQTQAGSRDDVFRAFRLAALGQPGAADCIWWYGQWLTDEGYVRLGRLMVEEGTRATASEANKMSGARYVRIRLGAKPVSKRAESLFLVGRQRFLRDGDYEGAGRLFDEAIRLAPEFTRPYNYRALIAWQRGDTAGAIGWLERAVAADAQAWRSHRNLGQLLSSLERWTESEKALRKTVELFDDDAGARLAYARVLYALGRHDEYLQQTRRALGFAGGRAPEEVKDVATFLARFERWGPGPALPPAPDPRLLLGWNYD